MLNSNHMDKDEENYLEVDAIAEWIREVPKPAITIIAMETYNRMRHSFYHIRKAFEAAGYAICPQVEIDPLFHLGSISIEVEDISELDISNFNIALSDADIFEIYPLSNGKLRLELTFHGILKAIC